jgi:hypothetical protein
MRGADKLIELRRSGRRPAVVFLNDYPTHAAFLDGTTVDISGDDLSGLDLRFLVGLTVSTGATTENRAKAILEACKRAGAAVVACCLIRANPQDRTQTDFLEIWNGTHPA